MGYGLQALAPSRTLKTLWVQEELSGLVAEALSCQLLRVPEAQRKQLEMLLGQGLGFGRGWQGRF